MLISDQISQNCSYHISTAFYLVFCSLETLYMCNYFPGLENLGVPFLGIPIATSFSEQGVLYLESPGFCYQQTDYIIGLFLKGRIWYQYQQHFADIVQLFLQQMLVH